MTREAKIGLLMVSVLIGVFGFLVYKRVTRPADHPRGVENLLADKNHEKDDDTPLNREDMVFEDVSTDGQPEPPEDGHRHRHDDHSTANAVRVTAHNETEEELVEEPASIPSAPSLGHHGHHHVETAESNEEETAESNELAVPPVHDMNDRGWTARRRDSAATETLNVPEELPETVEQAREEMEERRESDHFPTRASLPQVPEIEEEPERPARHHSFSAAPVEEPEPELEVPEITSRSEMTETELLEDEPPLEREPLTARETTIRRDSPSHAHRRPTSVSAFEDDVTTPAEPSHAEPIRGKTYVIQQNDNFWTISKQRYGTPRYHLALAHHNQRTIPDPKRMKPGTVIETPEPELLDRLNREIRARLATEEVEDSESTAPASRSANSTRPGYFVDDLGGPSYRVGENDTLGDIAKNHLRRASRWVQIREMNRNVLQDGNELKTGMVLRLPADASAFRVERSAGNLR